MKKKYITERYDSLNAFTQALERPKIGTLGGETFHPDFVGVDSAETADRLLIEGDSKTVHLIQGAKVKREATEKRSTLYRSCAGFVPIVGAAMAGHPQNMLNVKESARKTKILNLVYILSVDYSQTPESLAAAGEKILNAIYTLENTGYRVNLYVANISFPRVDGTHQALNLFDLSLLVKIKDSGKHLNVSKIAYPLANPAFFRYHIFKYLNTMIEGLNSAYVVDDRDAINTVLGKVFPKGCAWETFYTARDKSEEEIIENLVK